jgi:hypothetical protein
MLVYAHRMWDLCDLLQLMTENLAKRADEILQDQSPFGLDSLSEIELHPLLAQSFTQNKHGALREVVYPTSHQLLPNKTQRERCDMVLTPLDGQQLFDSIDEHRTVEQSVGTLFEGVATIQGPAQNQVTSDLAFWIEVKSVAQWTYIDRVPGPNKRYAQELVDGPSKDVIKLASEPMIRNGAALVVLFTEDAQTGDHDLRMSVQSMIQRDLPIRMPEIASFEIPDYGGNGWCTLGLIPVKF